MIRRYFSQVVLSIASVFGLVCPLSAQTGNNSYNSYSEQLKEKLGVVFSVPEKKVKFYDSMNDAVIRFGEYDSIAGSPIFYADAPIVKLSKHCSVVLMDMNNFQKPRPAQRNTERDYNWPVVTSYMLNNCGTPWAYWYIMGIYGVRMDDDSGRLSAAQLANLQKKVAALRSKNELCYVNGDLTEKVNCDRVFIVRIPNIGKIRGGVYQDEYPFAGVIEDLKSGATECYGVEFYKKSSIDALQMLFFINGDKTSINDCVSLLAEYIKFE